MATILDTSDFFFFNFQTSIIHDNFGYFFAKTNCDKKNLRFSHEKKTWHALPPACIDSVKNPGANYL